VIVVNGSDAEARVRAHTHTHTTHTTHIHTPHVTLTQPHTHTCARTYLRASAPKTASKWVDEACVPEVAALKSLLAGARRWRHNCEATLARFCDDSVDSPQSTLEFLQSVRASIVDLVSFTGLSADYDDDDVDGDDDDDDDDEM
jgi:hypothetical protein